MILKFELHQVNALMAQVYDLVAADCPIRDCFDSAAMPKTTTTKASQESA